MPPVESIAVHLLGERSGRAPETNADEKLQSRALRRRENAKLLSQISTA